MYKQIRIRQDNTNLTTWVEDRPKLKKGAKITLKEYGEVLWEVLFVSKNLITKAELRGLQHISFPSTQGH